MSVSSQMNALAIQANTQIDGGLVLKMEQERIAVERQVDASMKLIEDTLDAEINLLKADLAQLEREFATTSEQAQKKLDVLPGAYWKGKLDALASAAGGLGGSITERDPGFALNGDGTLTYNLTFTLNFTKERNSYMDRTHTIHSDPVKVPKEILELQKQANSLKNEISKTKGRIDELRTEVGSLDYNRARLLRKFNAQQVLADETLGAQAKDFANAALSKLGLAVDGAQSTARPRKRV